jgi:formylglycine-generating enzyme required for sulfatase activity
MSLVIRLKKPKRASYKEAIVVVAAVLLTISAIKASDGIINGRGKEDMAGSGSPCQSNMVYLETAAGGFCLDKYEASPGEKCIYADPANSRESAVNLDSKDCLPSSEPGKIPWRNISQDQARLACAKAGKRLPSNQEWFQAALGTNDTGGELTNEDCQLNSNWKIQPGTTGAGNECKSPAGASDMIGNLWEWVEGTVSDGIIDGKKLPLSGYVAATDGSGLPGLTDPDMPNSEYNNDYFWLKESGLRAIARGGYWASGEDGGQYSAYIVIPPNQAETGIGFRCAK